MHRAGRFTLELACSVYFLYGVSVCQILYYNSRRPINVQNCKLFFLLDIYWTIRYRIAYITERE